MMLHPTNGLKNPAKYALFSKNTKKPPVSPSTEPEQHGRAREDRP